MQRRLKLDPTVPESMKGIPISPNFPYASLRGTFDCSRYAVLDAAGVHSRAEVERAVAERLGEGASVIELRGSGLEARTFTAFASAVAVSMANAGVRYHVPLVLAGRADVSWACRRMGIKVDGVRLGQSDLQPVMVRALLGDEALVGLSVGTPVEEDAAAALPRGCVDFLVRGDRAESVR